VCEQLQLTQNDGAVPSPADIRSNPISIAVRTSYETYGRGLVKTWNLTVPASGIVTLTVPVDPVGYSISMTVFSFTVNPLLRSVVKQIVNFDILMTLFHQLL